MGTRGINLAMNRATIEESRKAIEQSERLKRLTLGLEDPSESRVRLGIAKGWLSNPRKHLSVSDELAQLGQAVSEATWLLIFDNAGGPMILADYWPQGSGSILITSRDPLAKSMFTRRPSGLDLGPLSQQDSLSVFNHLTTISNEPEDTATRQIADALGGVPRAIWDRYQN
ncbi:LOW QUALITY PROTEIN: hypothetical protein IFM46972_10510 [Aspergillus udagawae]|uniref:NB-ARC domain-containing protein n=1 Tax=Aspergillus udagawae TaxID=91492 RepID=A0A8H3SD40_9EURO|nr:LOW QUALITY PROTEIN: hypothetical protein IFM46972_10510 [Aspergillus udagawae]